MAIDYSGYAQSFAGRPMDTSGIQRGIERWQEQNQKNAITSANKFMQDFVGRVTKPYADLAFNDISELLAAGTMPTIQNAGAAFQQFKREVEALPNMQKKAIYNSGLMNALAFKQEFDAAKQAYIPMFEKKLEAYRLTNDMNNRDTRNFLGKIDGLKKFMITNGNPAGEMRELSLPYHGPIHSMRKWWRDDWTAGGVAAAGALGTAGLVGTAMLAKKIPWSKGNVFAMGDKLDAKKTISKTVDPFNIEKARNLVSKYETKLEGMDGRTKKAKNLKRQVEKLKLKPEQYTKAAEKQIKDTFGIAGKSKGFRNYLMNPGGWKNMLKGAGIGTAAYMGADYGARKIAGALGAGEKGQEVAARGASVGLSGIAIGVNQLIKRKGLPWVLAKLTKKAGTGIVLRLAGKLGVGIIGGSVTGGLGTAAMVAFSGYEISQLLKAVRELSAEQNIAPAPDLSKNYNKNNPEEEMNTQGFKYQAKL